MSKSEMARKLSKILANGNAAEASRLFRHHMKRTLAEVRQSLSRWVAIDAMPQSYINAHCGF